MPISIIVFSVASSSRWLSRARNTSRSKPPARNLAASSGSISPVASQGADRYRALRRTCMIMDYGTTAFSIALSERYNSGENFHVRKSIMFMYLILFLRYTCEFLKAAWFADILPAAKVEQLASLRRQAIDLCSADGVRTIGQFLKRVLSGEGVWKEFRDRNEERRSVLHTIFYVVKIVGIFIPCVKCFQFNTGKLHLSPVTELVPLSDSIAVPRLVLVYLEFLAMSVIKDVLSMGILHRLMHHPRVYKHVHKTHHLPMKECSLVHAFYFDIPDLIIENSIAPSIMAACFRLVGLPARSHSVANLFLGTMDFQIHSVAPYTVCFHNPLLDRLLNCNISHQLHHALSTDHFTVWPWHQLGFSFGSDGADDSKTTKKAARRSVDTDMAHYNAVFATQFPCGQ